MPSETIFAAASGFGRAAVCVVRVSGPGTRAVLDRMARGVPTPRRLTLRKIVDPTNGEPLDQALVVWMPAPHSFTGEDQAEMHLHGGLAVRTAVLQALITFEGCRPATPGEFTRRAFLNGRLDLSSVEGLADLIDAETEVQRRQALRQLEGKLGSLAEGWRCSLVEALALVEAALDFADEGDVPDKLEAEARDLVTTLVAEMWRHLEDGKRGERLREGYTVVIAGPPNAGKSTLLNALAQRNVAIVSPIPGTTRDVIEVKCDLDGLPVTFVDTAGWRQTDDSLEQEGVARAKARVAFADLVLWLEPANEPSSAEQPRQALKVGSKADLLDSDRTDRFELLISAETGDGLADLLQRVESSARTALGHGDAAITRQRHRDSIQRAAVALDRCRHALSHAQTELAAEDLRLAAQALGSITGRVDVEHILDQLFAKFCIGK